MGVDECSDQMSRYLSPLSLSADFRFFMVVWVMESCTDPKVGGGDRGSGPILKNHKILGFLAIIVPIPCKIAKLPSQQMLGHDQNGWQADDGPLLGLFWILSSSLPSSKKTNLSELDPLWKNFLDPRMENASINWIIMTLCCYCYQYGKPNIVCIIKQTVAYGSLFNVSTGLQIRCIF